MCTFLLQSGALWDKGLVQFGIVDMDIFDISICLWRVLFVFAKLFWFCPRLPHISPPCTGLIQTSELALPHISAKFVCIEINPNSKVYGANMGPTWCWRDPDGPHIAPMNLAIWELMTWKRFPHYCPFGCEWTGGFHYKGPPMRNVSTLSAPLPFWMCMDWWFPL